MMLKWDLTGRDILSIKIQISVLQICESQIPDTLENNIESELTNCEIVSRSFLKMFSADIHMSLFGAIGNPVLDFWWCPLWVLKEQGAGSSLFALQS